MTKSLQGAKSNDLFSYLIIEDCSNTSTVISIFEIYENGGSTNSHLTLKLNETLSDFQDRKEEIIKHVEDITFYKENPNNIELESLHQELKECGNALYKTVFESRILTRGEKLLVERLFSRSEETPGRISLISDHFAIEYQFLLALSDNDKVNSFLGSKYFFSRNYPSVITTLNNPTQPIKLKYCINSEFSVNEIANLSSSINDGIIELISATHGEKIENLLKQIDQYDFFHLGCHFEEEDNSSNSRKGYLDFGSYGTLNLTQIENIPNLEGKLFFLNGCRTGKANIKLKVDFSSTLIKRKKVGTVVSTDSVISENFASNFGGLFWSHLFNCEFHFDEALYKAKMEYSRKNNFGGFLYSIYGKNRLN